MHTDAAENVHVIRVTDAPWKIFFLLYFNDAFCLLRENLDHLLQIVKIGDILSNASWEQFLYYSYSYEVAY